MTDNDARHDNSATAAMIFMLAVFTLGFLAGAMIWQRTSADDGWGRLLLRTADYASCDSFALALRYSLTPSVPIFAVLTVCGYFVFGWIVAPAAVFYRAVGFGALTCCLFSGASGAGLGGAALTVVPGAATALIIVFLARDAAVSSAGFFAGYREKRSGFVLRALLSAVLFTAAALLQAAACVLR